MVYHDDLFIAHCQQRTSGQHTAILAVSVQNREISVSDLCHCPFDIADEIFAGECNQIIFSHKITYRGRLRDQSCYHESIMGCADDLTAFFLRQFLNGFGNGRTGTYHDTACIHFQTAKLIFKTVTCQQHIAVFYIVFQQVGVCRTDQDLTFCDLLLRIAYDHGTIDGIQYISIFCMRHSKDTSFINIHICCRNILDGNDALQSAVVIIYHRHGGFLYVSHNIPRIFQGNIRRQYRGGFDVYVFYLCAHMFDQFRCFHSEKVQYIFCFIIYIAGSFCHIFPFAQFVFQCRIGDSGTDRICVGVFMTDYESLIFS